MYVQERDNIWWMVKNTRKRMTKKAKMWGIKVEVLDIGGRCPHEISVSGSKAQAPVTFLFSNEF